jgi:thiamine pyrophosphate-dependent acetolactate synthase large subunit-like protein
VSADIVLPVDPDMFVTAMVDVLPKKGRSRPRPKADARKATVPAAAQPDEVPTLAALGHALSAVRGEREICLARVPLNWPAGTYLHRHPLDYLGYDGGGGVGSGPGMTIGAALALKGSGRLVVGIIGDGEFLGAPTALWTAAHYGIPALFAIANNRSYYTDEIQQEAVAVHRGRPPENKWIGQQIDSPAVDIAGLATNFGIRSEPSIVRVDQLEDALERGLKHVEEGHPYLLDIKIDPTRGSSVDWLTHH